MEEPRQPGAVIQSVGEHYLSHVNVGGDSGSLYIEGLISHQKQPITQQEYDMLRGMGVKKA